MRFAFLLTLSLSLFASLHSVARAQDALPSPTLGFTDSRSDREARRAYSLGRQAFESGNGDTARTQFSRAHELSALPELLYFMARAEQLRGDREAAKRLYEELLTGFADATLRQDAEARLSAMRTVMPAPTPVVTIQTGSGNTILRPISTAPVRVEEHSNIASEWWFWTMLAVGAVAIGTGVGLAVHFSSNPTISEIPVEGNIRGQSTLQY